MMVAVAQTENLTQQVRIDGIRRRTGEERTLEQDKQGPDIVLGMQSAIHT